MIETLYFRVPGRPRPQKRDRFGRGKFGEKPHSYDAPENKVAKEHIAWFAKDAASRFPPGTFHDCPLLLEVWCYFKMPKSWSKAKRRRLGVQYHTQKPDGDNLKKMVCDALTYAGVIGDDKWICDKIIHKRWSLSDENTTNITLQKLAAE